MGAAGATWANVPRRVALVRPPASHSPVVPGRNRVLFADLFFGVLIWYRLSSGHVNVPPGEIEKGPFGVLLEKPPIDLAGVDFIKENPGETPIRIDLRTGMETSNPRGKPRSLWQLSTDSPTLCSGHRRERLVPVAFPHRAAKETGRRGGPLAAHAPPARFPGGHVVEIGYIDLAGVDFIKEKPGETPIRIDLRARMETANVNQTCIGRRRL